MIIKSGLFGEENLSAFWIQDGVLVWKANNEENKINHIHVFNQLKIAVFGV